MLVQKSHYRAMMDVFDQAKITHEDVTGDIDHLRREYRVPDSIEVGRVIVIKGGTLFFFDGADRCVGTGVGDEMGIFYPVEGEGRSV